MTVYEYRKLKVDPRGWRRVADAVHGPIADAAGTAGGSVFHLGSGLIGAGNDEGYLITAWPDTEVLAQRGAATLGNMPGVVESSNFARLTPSARPHDTQAPSDPGVYAHRWFSIDVDHWPEFLDLSENRIWPYIETYGARIVGFWRNMDSSLPENRVLLVTRYASMSEWDRTRLESSSAPPGSNAELYADARAAVLRRAELTRWSIVRILRPILA